MHSTSTFNLPNGGSKSDEYRVPACTFATSPQEPSWRNTGSSQTQANAAPTYRLCCLLQLWVPSLGRIRARQPLLLSTISGPGQQQDWCERGGQPRGKRKRLLLTIHSGLALIIKTTELPHAGAPPSHLASSPICSNRLCCRHEREGSWTWGKGQEAENK